MGILYDAALTFGVALAAAPVVLRVLRRVQVLDLPTARSSHQLPTPRGGGMAPALACVLVGAISPELSGPAGDALLFVAACLALIGLADDLHPCPVLPRLLGQSAVVMAALLWLLPGFGGDWLFRAVVGGEILGGVVGYANVFNFMDGINGLAVAQVVVAGVSWWVIGSHQHVPALAAAGLIAAAAAVAFAPFNLPRARMFLGDVGSYFFGGWLSVAAIVGLRAGIPPEAVVAPLAVFVGDAGVTLVQRVRRHEAWLQPHNQHAYQRLVQSGWSHGRTSLVLGLVMAMVSALGALSLTGTIALRIIGDIFSLAIVAGYLILTPIVTNRRVSGSAPATIR